MMSKTAIRAAFFVFSLLVFVGVATGISDVKSQAIEHIEYCEKVSAKVWPDYKGMYKQECSAKRLREVEQLLN